jgi:hypothetical protein
MPERYGYQYREPRWVQRGNGEWYLAGGDWVRRGDHRYGYDDRRYDERRYGGRFGPYGDRDGEGVPNRYDRFPDDPNRS